ncbi:hypothetical protein VTO7225_02641 [Vibrio toranzoniae]|nr:hypothetical protein VTO7225_02641 [Vibrio toranzoniae]
MCVSLILSFIPLKTGSPISKLVLLKLADNADARGVCFPSLNYLAQYCEVSVRTVKRHLNELEKQGFVKRIKRFDKKAVSAAICINYAYPAVVILNRAI